MTKEVPPLVRPDDIPLPVKNTVVRVKHDGTVKQREVWAYDDRDIDRQRYALELMRRARVSSKYSMGGQPSMRLTYNVRPHIRAMKNGGSRAFYLLDLKDAFPNVDGDEITSRLYKLIGKKGVDLDRTEKTFLETYMYEGIGAFLTMDGEKLPGVPQGNATSGAMLDVLLNEADYRLGNWFRMGVYTRFIDDLSFSGPADPKTGKFPDAARRTIRNILNETPGVVLNDDKTQNLTAEKPITITGISFNKQGLMAPSPSIQQAIKECFEGLNAKCMAGEELTKLDIDTFDGYRGALALAGPPEHSGSQVVRRLYKRSIRIGNRAYEQAAQQGIIEPRKRLVHAAAVKTI